VLRWMRERNRAHPDEPVRLVGRNPTHRTRCLPTASATWSLAWPTTSSAGTSARATRWCTGAGSPTRLLAPCEQSRSRRPRRPPNAGSYMRDRFGDGYLSVGLTLDHGWVDPGAGPQAVPPPPPGRRFAETVPGRTATWSTSGAGAPTRSVSGSTLRPRCA
jgi:erythromycin esterase